MPPSRQTLLVRVGCAEQTGLRHLPGDHLGVFPANREELVRGVLERVEDPPPPEQPLGMESRDGDPAGTGGTRGDWGKRRRYRSGTGGGPAATDRGKRKRKGKGNKLEQEKRK